MSELALHDVFIDHSPLPQRLTRWGRRQTRRALQAAMGVPLLRLAYMCCVQERSIFPGQWSQGHCKAQKPPCDDAQMIRLRPSGCYRSVAAFAPALNPDGSPEPTPARRPTVLFFYGNDMYLAMTGPILQLLRRCGANVLIPEYVGYGMSDGTPSEAGCYATAEAAYRHLLSRRDIDPHRIVLAGASLGGAVAIDLASRINPRGLITLVTFSSLVDLARLRFPGLPVESFMRHHFHSEAKMSRITCPVLIAHSTHDQMIPYAMSDRLARAARGPVTRLRIERAGHNSTEMLALAGDRIEQAVRAFLQTHV